jgi:hypothetical protein
MSLINEALKKAQRLRSEDATDVSDPAQTGGIPTIRRGKPDNASTMVLIGSGALVLVVLSVVFTVYLVNRPLKPAAVVVSTSDAKAASAAVTLEPSAPAIVAPKITLPAATTTLTEPTTVVPAPAIASAPIPPAPQAATSDPVIATAPLAVDLQTASATPPPTVAAPVVQTPTPATPLAPDAPDERVAAFVEAIRVTGIRSSGAESRVLMNERVYRVNDIVERTMNIRLVKAAADNLTFSDSRGVIYVKRF